jgi:hypothetical protein
MVEILASEPTFVVEVSRTRLATLPHDARVEIESGSVPIGSALIGTEVGTDADTVRLSATLASPCPTECAMVPVVGESRLSGSVTLLSPLTGPVVPISSIETGADGRTLVSVRSGTGSHLVEVHVLASTRGLAVVSGVNAGDAVAIDEGSK